MLALKSLQFKEFLSTPLIGSLSVSFEYTQVRKSPYFLACQSITVAAIQLVSL